MPEDDDLDHDEFEDEDAPEDSGSFDPDRAQGLIKKLRKQLDRQTKSHKKALEAAKDEAVETYRTGQKKVAEAQKVFGGFGYKGFAEDYLKLHEVEEVKPDDAREWLEARGLQIQEQEQQPQATQSQTPQPQPQAPQPSPAANFHQGGGTPTQGEKMTYEEFSRKFAENPAGAVDEAKARGMQDPGGLGEL